MKKITLNISPKERSSVGILAKQLHTTRTCVMHKALHTYARALRHQRIRKELVRIVQLGSKTTMSLKDRMELRALMKESFHKKSHLRTKRRILC